ncbi:MAG: YwiC-like family protein [Cyanobacteria bacterium P01_F01_bin.53]
MSAIAPNAKVCPRKRWYQPTVSPEHGVYVMLIVSFLTGAAAAQHWTWMTTLALVCAYCGFQAEHPLVLQIKQRHSWKPRFLLWTAIYGGIAGAIALWLLWQVAAKGALAMICGAVLGALLVDGLSVWQRQQKSILNELVTFGGVCLSAPLAYLATTGTLSATAIALWLLNTVFFSGAIFTVKLRKVRTASILSGVIFHMIAVALILTLWQIHWLTLLTASALGVAVLKFGLILWQKDWYCSTKIQQVALLETGTSLLFLAIAALSLLPTHLR